jgi:xylulokinase
VTTDRGDASGTGYWSPATGEYRLDLLERASAGSAAAAGRARPGRRGGSPARRPLAPGRDNAAAALGVGAVAG